MKKWMKGTGIAALVMIAAGGILMLGGGLLGGRQGMEGLVARGLLQVSAAEKQESGIVFDSGHEIWSGEFTQKLDALPEDGAGRLELETANVSVNILEAEGETASVEGDEIYRAQVYAEDGTLYVRADSEARQVKWLFGGGRRSNETVGELTLYLPKGFSFEKTDLTVGAGDVTMDELDTRHLFCNVGMGALDIGKLAAQDAEIYLGMGDISLQDAVLSDMTADIGMGSLYMNGTISGDLTGTCGMGSMLMELSGEESDHDYEVAASMGSVQIGSREYSGMSACWNSDNEAAGLFDLDVSMGTVEIYFTNP